MKAREAHIVIAGCGMAGLSLALLLDRALPAAVRISIIEGVALRDGPAGASPYHPSFDARSTALSYSTAQIYRELGIWEQLLPGMAPIETIHVSRRGRFGSTLLGAREQGWEALGWVVENPCLGHALLAAVRERPRIAVHCPARVRGSALSGAGVEVHCEGEAPQTLVADLLVIADGAASTLRDGLGFHVRRRHYEQSAVIANLAFARPLAGCAYERFTGSGPLALLPLPPGEGSSNRAALVWSLPPARAEAMLAASQEVFTEALLDAFGYRLGRLLRVGERHAYPLVLTEAVEQLRRGMVVIGNAAHALHPVAGQGFNLALRDTACLARTLGAAWERGLAPGDLAVLEEYMALREADQTQTTMASDLLPGLFANDDPILSFGRDLALSGLDLLPAGRSLFVREAAGIAALEVSHG